jgi:acetyltransferase-like isoleucine patch superfamily enzyme
MYVRRFHNLESEAFQFPESNSSIQCAPFSTIIDSVIEGPLTLEKYSCINRSTLEGCNGIGLHSYISDSKVGKYTLIGSRVSVGGFEHPTNWLSIGAFQWGQSVDFWGLSPSMRNNLNSFEKPISETTQIGPDCWIGNNSVILSGITLSPGVIVGSGSVVTKDVPAFAIVVGNPARIIRYRFPQDTIDRLIKIRWWDYDLEVLNGVNFTNVDLALEFLENLQLP